jgi:hypothetical protein
MHRRIENLAQDDRARRKDNLLVEPDRISLSPEHSMYVSRSRSAKTEQAAYATGRGPSSIFSRQQYT